MIGRYIKRKIIAYCTLAAILLGGCGNEPEYTEESSLQSQAGKQAGQQAEEPFYQANETFVSIDPGNENLAGLLQEKAGGVMVQITTDKLLGSGCIWSITEKQAVIVTVGHVLEGAEKLQLTFIDGGAITGTEKDNWQWEVSEQCDLGWIVLPTAEIPQEALESIRYVAVDKAVFDTIKAGDTILVMGSLDGVAGNAYEGSLTEPWIYMEDYDQYMMLAHTYAQPGMSGAGVFDSKGHFLGLLSGADDEGNLAVLPLSLIFAHMDDCS